ncbi:MAG: serine--tRNA ligase, partial [Bacteroidia bacterium]
MLQLAVLRENTQEVKERLNKRNPAFAVVVDEVLVLDEKTRAAKQQMENHQAEANKIAKQVGELMKSGKREEAEEVKKQSANLKEQAKQLEETVKQLEEELFAKLVTIPNTPNVIVPEGKTPEENLNVVQNGE